MLVEKNTRKAYLQTMGIPVWLPRASGKKITETGHEADNTQIPELPKQIVEQPTYTDLRVLAKVVESCHKCELSESRTRTVFGVGNENADWFFVGEAPGADEDRMGEPFVGRAGQLLNAMLFALGLNREEVYIANVLKCRPPGNRDPRPEEVELCEGYLRAQINLIKPKVIIALGRHAAHSLLKTDKTLANLRGRSHDYHGIPLVVTYHPAYLLRSPGDKSKSWQDLCLVYEMVNQ